ncbi:MAG: DUF4445 domain-containing protein [Clostridia bacterium]|nr:DUF4445 domain-containing protein [Clostridia bacterium]
MSAEAFLNEYFQAEIGPEYEGLTVADAVKASCGFLIDKPCGGRGKCGKCAVFVLRGIQAGFPGNFPENIPGCCEKVLACSEKVPPEGMTVFVPASKSLGVTGGGISGKNDGFSVENGGISGKNDLFSGDTHLCDSENTYLAVDVGTTTVEAALAVRDAREECGYRVAATLSRLNPQKIHGADVISRIQYSKTALSDGKTGLLEMQSEIAAAVNGILADFRGRFGEECARKNVVVAGNTTMQHLFCGVSPEKMGVFPFTPEFTGLKVFSGAELGIDAEKVTVLPSADAFIGADVVAGVFAERLDSGGGKKLFVDLGTNGEMVLSNGGVLAACSTAAGPCFEGANISCGTGGVPGAVSRVSKTGGKFVFSTVGDEKPKGICGSGLVDVAAILVEDGTIDETGRVEEDFELRGEWIASDGSVISEDAETGVVLTQKDVRELQLAKAAVRAGMEVLLESENLSPEDVDSVLVAGGLGKYINAGNAATVGIFPEILAEKVVPVGNSSLKGALLAGASEENLSAISEIAGRIRAFSLGGKPEFMEKYIDYMMFE